MLEMSLLCHYSTFFRMCQERFVGTGVPDGSERFTTSGLSLRASRRRVSFCAQCIALLQNSHFGRHRLQKRRTVAFLLVAGGFEPHGLAKFSAENLASVTSRL